MRGRGSFLLAGSVLALASGSVAAETVTYRYDELGRLIKVSRVAAVNSEANYSYDSADNRSKVTVGVGGAPPPPPSPPPPIPPPPSPPPPSPPPSPPPPSPPPPSPPPPPPPPPGNLPPVTVNNSGEIMKCLVRGTFIVIANDSDPDGNTPLSLAAVSYPGGLGTTSVVDTRVRFTPNGAGPGTAVITYTVADNLGATATGTLTLEVIQGQCP